MTGNQIRDVLRIHLKAATLSHRNKKAKVGPTELLEHRLPYHLSYLLYCLTMRKRHRITPGNGYHFQGVWLQRV